MFFPARHRAFVATKGPSFLSVSTELAAGHTARMEILKAVWQCPNLECNFCYWPQFNSNLFEFVFAPEVSRIFRPVKKDEPKKGTRCKGFVVPVASLLVRVLEVLRPPRPTCASHAIRMSVFAAKL